MEKIIAEVKKEFGESSRIASLFENCYRDTLEKTMKTEPDGTTYAITGDIPAMWLRDSAAQIRPYFPVARRDKKTADLILGLVKKQFQFMQIDPYANAFNETPSGACWAKDETESNDWVWERKYEIDSLCYPVELAYLLWKHTGYTTQFDENFIGGIRKILQVFRTEQHHEEDSAYRFIRRNSYFTDTLSRNGKGALVKSGIGLTWSGFRPSDDACTYGYLIPSNMFASVILRYAEEIAENIIKDDELAKEARRLSEEIRTGIETYGITKKEGFGEIYAYEVDGFGQFNLMDDANVPSLLSMRYLGYQGQKEVYENTRRFLLCEANPYYYEGKMAKGIGSAHTPMKYIWHIALSMEGLTEEDRGKKRKMIELLTRTDGGCNRMHEGFHADDPTKYTREWFSWANAMFCELVLDYCGYSVSAETIATDRISTLKIE